MVRKLWHNFQANTYICVLTLEVVFTETRKYTGAAMPGESFKFMQLPPLTHQDRVMQICVNEIGHNLVQIMACRLFGVMPLSKRILTYCQMNLEVPNSVKFESWKYNNHHSIFIRVVSVASWQSYDCPKASEVTLADTVNRSHETVKTHYIATTKHDTIKPSTSEVSLKDKGAQFTNMD